jgi:exosome complex component RRP42
MDIANLTKRRMKDYLNAGKRFDKRNLSEYRNVEIETGISKNAEGSARVKLGNTEVVAGVKLALGEPYPDKEDEGTMVTTVELLPLSSDNFEYGPPRIDAIEIARIIDRGIRESEFIDFKKLCIKEGEKVWIVYIDIYTINDEGNILDAGALASIAALKEATIPKYNEEKDIVNYEEKTNKKLPLGNFLPLTFTFHKIGDNILVDPVTEEEKASEGRLSVALYRNSKKEMIVSALQKGQEKTLSQKEIIKIIEMAEKQYKEIEKEFADIGKNLKNKSKKK